MTKARYCLSPVSTKCRRFPSKGLPTQPNRRVYNWNAGPPIGTLACQSERRAANRNAGPPTEALACRLNCHARLASPAGYGVAGTGLELSVASLWM